VDTSSFGDSSGTNGNGSYGLEAYSNGAITLTDVTADGNYNDGAYLQEGNCYYNSSSCIGTGMINVSGDFSGNGTGEDTSGTYGYGVEAYTNGSITLSGVTAENNWYDGAYLQNNYSGATGTINVGGDFSGNGLSFDLLYGNGVEAYSNNDIILSDVTANDNYDDGALVDNTLGAGNIIVTNSIFGDSSWIDGNGSYGLEAFSSGNIMLNNIIADWSGYSGTNLRNINGSGNIGVNNSSFNLNSLDGADLFSFSTMTLNNVIANDNGGDGLFVSDASESLSVISDNTSFQSGATLNVTDGTFNDNVYDGIDANIGGDITLTRVTADGNGYLSFGDGLFGFANNITATCSDLSNNHDDGADVGSNTLTLNSVTLSGNGSSPINFSGTPVINSVKCGRKGNPGTGGLPINLIPITGNLDCIDYSGNELVLPNQDHALLPCPNGQDGTITHKSGNQLPGALDGKFTYVSAFNVQVTPSLVGTMTVSFKIPVGKPGANFTILHWDGTKWVSLGGSANPPGFFSVDTNLTGDFVLVTQ
jgi:hypothetical protein